MPRSRSTAAQSFGPSWRVAPENEPPTARRCRCPSPQEFEDDPGEIRCIKCGYPPSVRLGPGPESKGSSDQTPKNPLAVTENRFIGFHAPPALKTALEERASRNDRSVAAELRQMCRAYLSESAQPARSDAFKNRVLDPPAREAA